MLAAVCYIRNLCVLGTLLSEDLLEATLREVDFMAESRYLLNIHLNRLPSDSVISTGDSRYLLNPPSFILFLCAIPLSPFSVTFVFDT